LAGFLKQKGQKSPLPAEQYEALRAAFDKAAGSTGVSQTELTSSEAA
jgi:hypothetical protein